MKTVREYLQAKKAKYLAELQGVRAQVATCDEQRRADGQAYIKALENGIAELDQLIETARSENRLDEPWPVTEGPSLMPSPEELVKTEAWRDIEGKLIEALRDHPQDRLSIINALRPRNDAFAKRFIVALEQAGAGAQQ